VGKKSSIPARRPNALQQVISEAGALDRKRQSQIANQIGAINRVLTAWKGDGAWQYDDEMQRLHELLAAEQARAAELESQLRELKEGDIVGKRKDAFLAGFAAGETEDDAQEAWAEYKEGLDTEPDTDEDASSNE
jgi:uncharacterized protein YukE